MVKANVFLHFKPGEFNLKNTPDKAVDSTITIKGATISYKPTHPPVTDVDAVVKFTGQTMDAKVSSAKYMDAAHVNSARVRFPDFYPDDVRLFVDMDVDAPAPDVQRFLALPDLDKAGKLNITREAAGNVSGNAKFDFIAFAENDKNDVAATGLINYVINGKLIDVSQKSFLHKHDVANADMKISLDNKEVELSGKAKINGVPMNIELKSLFSHDNPTTYAIKNGNARRQAERFWLA